MGVDGINSGAGGVSDASGTGGADVILVDLVDWQKLQKSKI